MDENCEIEKQEDNRKYYWYVLFVKTGYENRVVSQIKMYYDSDEINPFVFLCEFYHKYAYNKVEIDTKIMFPGYVFIESYLDSNTFRNIIYKFIRFFDSPLRLLRYSNSQEIAMRNEEKSLLLSLCNDDNVIEASVGFIVGEETIVTSGFLKDFKGKIKKIDRAKRKAIIEIDVMGTTAKYVVGIDIIKKLPDAQNENPIQN
jgi:transcriptional antiterminator NusG